MVLVSKAYTLIELLVVLGIIAAVLALGVQGMITFQRTVEFQQAVNDVLTEVKYVRNLARNNVASPTLLAEDDVNTKAEAVPAAYGYGLNNGTLEVYYCKQQSETAYSCFEETSDFQEAQGGEYSSVGYSWTADSNCSLILFMRLDGDVQVIQSGENGEAKNNQICKLKVQHSASTSSKIVEINSQNNSIAIE